MGYSSCTYKLRNRTTGLYFAGSGMWDTTGTAFSSIAALKLLLSHFKVCVFDDSMDDCVFKYAVPQEILDCEIVKYTYVLKLDDTTTEQTVSEFMKERLC